MNEFRKRKIQHLCERIKSIQDEIASHEKDKREYIAQLANIYRKDEQDQPRLIEIIEKILMRNSIRFSGLIANEIVDVLDRYFEITRRKKWNSKKATR